MKCAFCEKEAEPENTYCGLCIECDADKWASKDWWHENVTLPIIKDLEGSLSNET